MLLDQDAQVTGIASQPFRLSWAAGQRQVAHVPDYFVRASDGSALVIDVRPADRVGTEDAVKFAATQEICAEMDGWEYRLLHEPEPVVMANVRWLAGYRHPRNRDARFADELVAAFGRERPLIEGVEAVGDAVVVLPTLYHLLWSGVLVSRLDGLLDDGVLVAAGVAA